ncbi:hypothetical protein VK70_25130 [Paenibacillus durus ATCC 35681]|uniref:Uncharacterized protein n=1 Tax=Paenibacillus durus ATCC 35681 TaxID=1333534 RepID=A0A0F7FF69_PAEDU|nr:hypothetical protein VK70_25130 [Paenibacillus durus ATCC 35681]
MFFTFSTLAFLVKRDVQAIRTKFYAFPPISIREMNFAEHVPVYEQGRSLNKGNLLISHIIVTKQKQFFTIQIHIVGSFSCNIS